MELCKKHEHESDVKPASLRCHSPESIRAPWYSTCKACSSCFGRIPSLIGDKAHVGDHGLGGAARTVLMAAYLVLELAEWQRFCTPQIWSAVPDTFHSVRGTTR